MTLENRGDGSHGCEARLQLPCDRMWDVACRKRTLLIDGQPRNAISSGILWTRGIGTSFAFQDRP